ncbi:hypothetical protein ASE71_08005 [Ensifer sp. Root954]|nr:hypothetical protein ASD49_07035 [Ensifer sp. Root1298]KQX76659.1 hypothetical protein ASD41_07285 [Ensifer sp. Root1312]KRC17171.1 hypothetical protein ASE29_07930 [Ensifer sp. Root74]KRD62201.1 hypothetical protein ASE71_08005 [Ensifer sp. Root954]
MTLDAITTAAIAYRPHSAVLAVSALGGGLEIRQTLLRIAEGLSHGETRRHTQGPALLALARVPNADGARPRQDAGYDCLQLV